MATTSPPLVPAHVSPPARPWLGGLAVASIALAFAAGLGGGGLLAATPTPHHDPCALPAGLELGALSAADRSWLARRTVACSDRAHGRTTADEYRAAIAALDAAPAPDAAPPAPPIVWAASVRGFSSQWSESSWSAAQVLGPPQIFPASGDDARAWASKGADDRVEWIEVGLDAPRRLSAVQLFESYNPGAVTRIELVSTSGARHVAYAGDPMRMGEVAGQRTFDFACTDEPIAAIRVTLDSPSVSGWNELDAIGGVPCE